MAKAPNQTQKETAPEGAVQTTAAPGGALADPAAMFAADAGAGMEGATAESFAIPFLSVLQKGSPQVDETVDSGAHLVPGAKAGMLYENINSRLFDRETGVTVVPCHYRRVFIRWGAKEVGGGFKGELLPEVVAEMRAKGQILELDGRLYVPGADGSVNPKRDDRIADVRNHYILLIDAKGGWTQALLSLGSTQIKKSKMLMSALSSIRLPGASGDYQPATFANLVKVTTVPEQNDKGSWFGVKFELAGMNNRPELYAAAKAFHASVMKGTVEVKYEDTEPGTGTTDSEAASRDKAAGNKF